MQSEVEEKDNYFNQLDSEAVDEDWCLDNGAVIYDMSCRWTINGYTVDWFDGYLIIDGLSTKDKFTKDKLKQLLDCLKGIQCPTM